jgi:hypothetical protein
MEVEQSTCMEVKQSTCMEVAQSTCMEAEQSTWMEAEQSVCRQAIEMGRWAGGCDHKPPRQNATLLYHEHALPTPHPPTPCTCFWSASSVQVSQWQITSCGSTAYVPLLPLHATSTARGMP